MFDQVDPQGSHQLYNDQCQLNISSNLLKSVKSNVRMFKQKRWFDDPKIKFAKLLYFCSKSFFPRWFPDSPVSSNGISLFSQQRLPDTSYSSPMRRICENQFQRNICETAPWLFCGTKCMLLEILGVSRYSLLPYFHQTRLYCILQRPT